jgi:transposase
MEILHSCCAGLDVHKKVVVATIFASDASGQVEKLTQSFETMTADLLALSDWLLSHNVTHAAMESTGEYWKPIFNILEANFEVLLVNAQHIKAVPGCIFRRMSASDSEPCRPPNPEQVGHRFRTMSATF